MNCAHRPADSVQGLPLSIPLDHRRPPVSAYFRNSVHAEIDRQILSEIANGDDGGANAYSALLAIFQALMLRYSDQQSGLIGTEWKGEFRALDASLMDDPISSEFVARTRASLESRSPDGSSGASQTTATDQKVSVALFSDGKSFDFDEYDARVTRTTSCDLALIAGENGDQITLEMNFDAELFEPQTVSRLLTVLVRLATEMAATPTKRISIMPLVSANAAAEDVSRFDVVRRFEPITSPLHQIFQQQARRRPDATAVDQAGEPSHSVTYRQLDQRANQLANWLVSQGAGAGTFVAIYLERSPDVVVAILGVLKAGAAYVPIDLAYPSDRIAFMLRDSAARLVITQQQLREQLPETTAKVVCLDTACGAIDSEPQSAPSLATDPRRARVPDLYVGVDRNAQGRTDFTPPSDSTISSNGALVSIQL